MVKKEYSSPSVQIIIQQKVNLLVTTMPVDNSKQAKDEEVGW